MPAIAVNQPFPLFSDQNGTLLDDAYLYFGVENLDPVANPITVYLDEDLTVTVAQPIRTNNGYPVSGGSPRKLYVAQNYSLRILDKNGVFVFASSSNTAFVQSDDVQFLQSGTGAVQITAQEQMRQIVSVKQFGAVGNGIADDTVAIQNALNTAKRVFLPGGGTYKVTTRLSVPSNGGIFSDGTGIIYAPAANFNNTSLSNKYASNSAVIDASGLLVAPFTAKANVELKDFIIKSEVSGNRLVDAITARNVNGLNIDGVEIYGFPVGCGVRAASVIGDSVIKNCKIHDFTDNTNWGVGTNPQITGIEIDNDRINSIGSKSIRILHNSIQNLTVGATFLAAHGYQTDGINLSHQDCQYFVISNNVIRTVGEGVDVFGQYGVISNNSVYGAYLFGIKLIHGARNNVVTGNDIISSGIAGITIAGSTFATDDTTKNVIIGNNIQGIDPNGAWSATSTSCIETTNNGGTTYKPRENLILGNVLNPAPNGKRAINRSSSGADNWFRNNYIISAGSVDYATNSFSESGRIRDAKPTLINAYASASQSIPSNVTTKVAFDAEQIDDRGEFNTSTNRWVCQIPGVYRVSSMLRFGSFAAGTRFSFAIYKNNSEVRVQQTAPAGTSDVSLTVNALVECVFGDFLEIFVIHTDASSRAITSGSVYSALIIEAA